MASPIPTTPPIAANRNASAKNCEARRRRLAPSAALTAGKAEAARAYGAPERRVLLDVKLPLARPAIMTWINQTLLLAFSMLGVAAIL